MSQKISFKLNELIPDVVSATPRLLNNPNFQKGVDIT